MVMPACKATEAVEEVVVAGAGGGIVLTVLWPTPRSYSQSRWHTLLRLENARCAA